jgi:hypothetical protein
VDIKCGSNTVTVPAAVFANVIERAVTSLTLCICLDPILISLCDCHSIHIPFIEELMLTEFKHSDFKNKLAYYAINQNNAPAS